MTWLRRLLAGTLLWAVLSPLAAVAQAPPPVPALPDTQRLTSYSITASTCACAVNFALFGDGSDFYDWLEVWINGVQVPYNSGTAGWTITSPTGPIGSIALPITDAVLTFNSVQTGTVQIVGARRPRRLSQVSENQGVPARTFNETITDLYAQNREIWDKTNDITGRGLFFAPGNATGQIPSPSTCASKVLGFDSTGLNPACFLLGASGPLLNTVDAAGATSMSNGVNGDILGQAAGKVVNVPPGSGLFMTGNTLNSSQIGVYAPEKFGALGNGSADDAPAIRSAMSALNVNGGGTLQLSCHATYRLASLGANGALINNYSNINIIGCGPSSILQVAAGMNTSSASFVFGIWPTGQTSATPINNVAYRNFTIDMNGTNNDCSGTCYAYNVALGALYGDNILVDGVNVINNAGSQGIAFGTNTAPPTVTNVKITNTNTESACDYINAACTDASAIWLKAINSTLVNNSCTNCGPQYATAFEVHGINIAATSNVANNVNKGMIVAADQVGATGYPSINLNVAGNSLNAVNTGIDVWITSEAYGINYNILGNTIILASGANTVCGIDAATHVAGTPATITISNNKIRSSLSGSTALLF